MNLTVFQQSYGSRLLMTWLAYFVFGQVSMLSATPVDHVSPFFLASGVALACMLSWGLAMWPAVALGGFAVGLVSHLLGHTAITLLGWLQLAVSGLGGAAQAALGVLLVRRFVAQPLTLDEPRDILLFLLLGGVVACTLNAALSTAALVGCGLMPGPNAWSIFVTWWGGDTLGALIAAPIVLTFIGQPAPAWRGRRWTVAVPMALATALMLLALVQVEQWDTLRGRRIFERDADTTFSELRLRLQRYVDAIEALRGVYIASESVSRDEFRRAAQPWMPELPGLQALAWAEPVRRADRSAFEAEQRSEGLGDFRIFDVPGRREPQGDDWVVVRYAEPQQLNRTVLGLNGRSMPNVEPAIDLALLGDRTVVSAPFRFIATQKQKVGVVLVRAVFKPGVEPGGTTTLHDVVGFVYAAVQVDDAVGSLLRDMPHYLAACLVDVQAKTAGGLAEPSTLTDLPECQGDQFRRAPVHEILELPFLGRTWQLRLWSRESVPGVEGYHWLFGVGGVALAAALGSLLLTITGRTRRIEVAVKDRTARLEFEIAERHHTEQALRESEQRFRAIFDSVPIGVVYTDLNGTIRQANPGFCALTGYAESSLVGMSLQNLAHPEDREVDGTLREQLLRGEQTVITRSQRYLTRTGQARQVQLSMRLLQNGTAHPLGLVGVVEDVTERMRLHEAERAREAAEASNRAKSEFLSRMSHELRTPLNAMLGFAQLLDLDQQTPLPPLQKGWVSQIQRAGWHLLEMINDVLDLSRIDTGTFRLELKPQSVVELVDSARQLVETQLQQRHITLNCPRESLAVPPVQADATRTRQILSNLLSNAIKYNREGGSVFVQARLLPSNEVAIDVSDTGMGMTPAQLRELFQPFNRLGRERSATEGTGIGLVISRRLAELMGGALTVRSEAGQGSTFTLVLPLAGSAGAQLLASEPESPYALALEAAAYHRRRVIYIEDNEVNASVMSGVFAQRPQVEFEIARNATEGLQAIARSLPDLILLDMHLPDFSGMDVLLRLKTDPHTVDIPVVMVSADVLGDQIQEALDAGAINYLTKPINVAEVLHVVDQLLEQGETVS